MVNVVLISIENAEDIELYCGYESSNEDDHFSNFWVLDEDWESVEGICEECLEIESREQPYFRGSQVPVFAFRLEEGEVG